MRTRKRTTMKISMTTKRMRTRTKRTRATRTGSKLLAILLLCAGVTVSAPKKGKAENVSYALLAGTVYRPPGFALPGVKVLIEPEQPESNGVKLKKTEA